ncbi:DUF2214 domain-containing protein [Acuticoccus mangrovi]|uniref:DUF2214 domain-containing protein n=1 Tax=Acuticoccus mangrovi TaxID=2796142 RepID=A0A934MET9_9HYPH|nr:DUF2214 domain-containing protein [Acuticoccus mangrovi]MBJ3777912.1 DUF2214 domain-containing protein [Acuticoccus mangrovi]
MEGLLAALEGSGLATWARGARWGYAALSGAHVLGIALLVGAMVPLNLVRLGLGRVPQEPIARVLVPAAGVGLALAAATGAVLFAVRASEYAALAVVQAKLILVALGTASALVLHAAYGWFMERAGARRRAIHAGVSLVLWLMVLALGRLIAFVG